MTISSFSSSNNDRIRSMLLYTTARVVLYNKNDEYRNIVNTIDRSLIARSVVEEEDDDPSD